jgi:hypothetical protein
MTLTTRRYFFSVGGRRPLPHWGVPEESYFQAVLPQVWWARSRVRVGHLYPRESARLDQRAFPAIHSRHHYLQEASRADVEDS